MAPTQSKIYRNITSAQALPVAAELRDADEDVEDSMDGIFGGIGAVERMKTAIGILKKVNMGMLHEDLKLRLTVPLYTMTTLEREVVEPELPGPNAAVAGTSAQQREAQALAMQPAYSEDEVLRKNLYHLASLLKNFKQVLIQLVQALLLRLEHKDMIEDQNLHKGESALKHLPLYSALVSINDLNEDQLLKLIRILRKTDNEESADLLELKNVPTAAIRAAATMSPVGAEAQAHTLAAQRRKGRRSEKLVNIAFPQQTAAGRDEEEPGTWACLICTYKNKPALNACEICESLKGQQELNHPPRFANGRVVVVKRARTANPDQVLERLGGGMQGLLLENPFRQLGQLAEDEPERSCRRCTFLNPNGTRICGACDQALDDELNFNFN